MTYALLALAIVLAGFIVEWRRSRPQAFSFMQDSGAEWIRLESGGYAISPSAMRELVR